MARIETVIAATVLTVHCAAAQDVDLTHVGPLNVERFMALRERLGIDPISSMPAYFADPIYNNLMNILIDSVLQSQGSKFCLPEAVTDRTTAEIFDEMVVLIDRAVKLAPPDDDLREAIVGDLARRFPCVPN